MRCAGNYFACRAPALLPRARAGRRESANDQLDLAGDYVVGLDGRIAVLVEVCAVAALHRGVFDNRYRRIRIIDHDVRQWPSAISLSMSNDPIGSGTSVRPGGPAEGTKVWALTASFVGWDAAIVLAIAEHPTRTRTKGPCSAWRLFEKTTKIARLGRFGG